jgi:hypothetical protein
MYSPHLKNIFLKGSIRAGKKVLSFKFLVQSSGAGSGCWLQVSKKKTTASFLTEKPWFYYDFISIYYLSAGMAQ